MRHLGTTFLTLMLAFFGSTQAKAQFGMSANIQNMHIWRGMQVTEGLVVTNDLSFTDPSNRFTAGFWGGANSSGSYKEFNNYISYSNNGLKVSLNDTYNFSPGASYNNEELFNYKASETGRFIDANVSYRFDGKLPFTLHWATIVYGRDRNATNSDNIYSTYCSVEYPIYNKEKWSCNVGMGSAFALSDGNSNANFYGERAGIVEVALEVTYNMTIAEHDMPIFTRAMWNPQTSEGYLLLGTTLFSF